MPKRLLSLTHIRQKQDSDCLAACTSMMLQAVVLVGYNDEHFYLNDPAFENAPNIVLKGELDLAWIAHDAYFATIYKIS